MGRRKQTHPSRSRGIPLQTFDNNAGAHSENAESIEPPITNNGDEIAISRNYVFVEVDRSYWASDKHFDIAEVILTNIRFGDGFSDHKLIVDLVQNFNFSLQFRLSSVGESSLKSGHWPVISVDNILLEFFISEVCDGETEKINLICSGSFDGPDEGVSGLVHLVSQKLLMLRPLSEISISDDAPSLRIRVEILMNAFNACESLLETTRQPWKKSMMNVMAWLHPEAMTQQAKYGISELEIVSPNKNPETVGSSNHVRFDATEFYEAIRPSKGEPMLEDELPDLLPRLRPYQSRAAYWMVQQEKRSPQAPCRQFFRPLCVPIDILDGSLQMFYNPFSGNISLHPESFTSSISGGILADEMGLGKTIELLACIFAHRQPSSGVSILSDRETIDSATDRITLKRLKRERVECICGATTESPKYKGIWVQCDVCDAWQHSKCVGFTAKRKLSQPQGVSTEIDCTKDASSKSRKRSKRKDDTKLTIMDGDHICSPCSELLQATEFKVTARATLIVCPGPILPQWHAEIIRHTKPGSLKICVYEGVRNQSDSTASRMNINAFVSADIVLTTYDVLREDLSHDSDRHEGDRRFMRFQKRYPVVPTPLTRIFWWRICLDEAQMVESNAAAATEMALRLHARHRWCITGTPIQRKLDDLYGLLRFLGASPFNIHRWWVEVIRDPYERRDVGAIEFTQNLFKKIMWRSSKVHVSDELQLPPQEEWLSWLTFSQIEAHFYQRQHETCVRCAHEVIGSIKGGTGASSEPFLAHDEIAKLLHSLLKLRQACCHPQVGSSGLRTLQKSPMTMGEILEVLVGKAKIEGEEALRRLVVAVNALAGIAAIEQDHSRAVSYYEEALALAEEHLDDFRLDPLLNIHIYHNLAELLPVASQQFSSIRGHLSEKLKEQGECDGQKISEGSGSGLTSNDIQLEHNEKFSNFTSNPLTIEEHRVECMQYPVQSQVTCRSFTDDGLRKACENLKQKFLSVFLSKLSLAQQEFRNSYVQVCDGFRDCKDQSATWWLQALDFIEQNKDSSNELIRKIEETVSKSSRISSRFRTMTGLKYLIQTSLDQLQTSREVLLEQLLEIDKTMESPKAEDIERVRYCPNCKNGDGPTCVLCELEDLFQVYEARLFCFSKGGNGGMLASEEAVDFQKRKFARNRFFGTLSQSNKNSATPEMGHDENKRKRDIGENILVSKSPSELEVILGVIKNYSKTQFGRDILSSSNRQLLLFEAMRKEYAHARSLSIAQAQVLSAYDEIKMATSRLRLRETENDLAALDALSLEELVAANVQYSNEKFLALSLLSRIKGQLRYLKGLMLSKQKVQVDCHATADIAASSLKGTVEGQSKVEEETCPVCQEKLCNQKMVFQCGHLTCCKWQMLMDDHPTLFWTPCAAHCIDLMLHDICKLPIITTTVKRAIALNGYIYNHPYVLNMMRTFTEQKELIRPGVTRFATVFLTLQSIYNQKNKLRRMFTSEEWSTSRYHRDTKGKDAYETVLSPGFWNILYSLRATGPLVRVLRMVDSEKKPAMGYIYEAMDRAKEAISKSFNYNEAKYYEIWEIIDKRWNDQLHRPLHAAGYYLNPEYFYTTPRIESNEELNDGFLKTMARLVPDEGIQNLVETELSLYRYAQGVMGSPNAIRNRALWSPGLVAMTEQALSHQRKGKWVMCPTCRQQTDYDNIAYVDDRQNKACTYAMPNALQGHNISEISVQVKGSYGTKIEAVTRRILWIRCTDPEAKVLVFSSWNDVLDVLEHALEANEISYIRMKGGRKSHAAITQFKRNIKTGKKMGERQEEQPETKSIQVLLLLIQHGANGLNILEAQHVVLIEPLLNPAAEAQAINRVHRIGQEKMTFVHRFIVKDTVEEGIYNLNRNRTVKPVISGNTKNQDQPVLTLEDVETLFSSSQQPESDEPLENLGHLPPAVAAALAAEKRLAAHST